VRTIARTSVFTSVAVVVLGDIKIEVALQTEPKLGGSAEVLREA